MYSHSCKACSAPLMLRLLSGEARPLLQWSVPDGGGEERATLLGGDVFRASSMVKGELLPCACGEKNPAELWPIWKLTSAGLEVKPLHLPMRIGVGQRHPEQEDDEVFLSNTLEVDARSFGWRTKRLGIQSYRANGDRTPGMRPLFMKTSEAHEAGLHIDGHEVRILLQTQGS